MDGLYKQDCALCLRSFEYCKSEPSENELVEKLEEICSAYIKPDISTKNYNWDYSWSRDNPICSVCKDHANHLWSLDDGLRKIENDLSEFLKLFREDIFNAREEKVKINQRDETTLCNEEQVNEDEGWNQPYVGDDDSDEQMISYPNSPLVAEGEHNFGNSDIKEENSYSEDSTLDSDPLSTDLLNPNPLNTLRVSSKRYSETNPLKKYSNKRKCRPRRKVAVKYEEPRYEENSSDDEECKSNESIQFEDIDSKRRNRKRGRKKSKTTTKANMTETFCKICNLQFSSWRGLHNHKNTHKGLNWHCEICDETFFSILVTRQRHMKVLHPEEDKIDGVKECEICQMTFEGSVQSYEIHCLEHKGEIPYECQTCHAKFSNGQSYADHFKFTSCGKSGLEDNDGVDKTFDCDQCDKVFNAKYLLLLHRLIHTNFDRSPFSCEICEKSFAVAGNGMYLAEKHFISHTKETPFPCDICGKRYGYVYSLEQHRFTHKGNENQTKCDICGTKFVNPEGLYRHKKYIQCGTNKSKAPPKKKNKSEAKTGSFLCDECGKSCPTQRGLLRHKSLAQHCKASTVNKVNLKSETAGEKSDEVNEANWDKTDVKPKTKFHCEVCGLDFVRQINYTKHLKFHTEENPIQCVNKDCNQKFRVFYDLKEHYNANPVCKSVRDAKFEKYKFTCKICGKGERTSATLRLHEMTHTGEKPFQCDQCGMSFNRKDRLKTHIHKHDESYLENPLSCKSCPFKCKIRKELIAHYNLSPSCHSKLQQIKKHKCDICEKRFLTKKLILEHYKENHNEGPRVNAFQCHICGKEFPIRIKLTWHVKTHSKNVANDNISAVLPIM